MCQLWVNLPKKSKMTKPSYQPIVDKKIPVVDLHEAIKDGNEGECTEPVGNARIIAGSLNGTKGPAKTFSPVELWDVTISKANATSIFRSLTTTIVSSFCDVETLISLVRMSPKGMLVHKKWH